MDSNINNAKELTLIKSILSQRKESAKIISLKLHDILYNNISKKEFIFIQRIIMARKISSIKIQSFFRGYIIRKTIHYYITKKRTCYLIETQFSKNFKNLQMIVVYNNKNKVFDLYYDKFFNKYIFCIDRILIKNDIYKIQFINEGKIIIDSNYETIEKNGIYYNKVDFSQIKANEEKYVKKNNKQIKEVCNFLKEKKLSIIPKNLINYHELFSLKEDEKQENNEFKSEETLDNSKLGGSLVINTPKKLLKKISKKEKLGSSYTFKKNKSSFLKGILKPRYSNERKLSKQNSLKVRFGSTEFSF